MSRPLFAFLCSIVFEAQAFVAPLSVSLALETFSTFCPQKGQNFEKDFKPDPQLAQNIFPSKMANKNGGKLQSMSAVEQ